jgi:hypothetical protein
MEIIYTLILIVLSLVFGGYILFFGRNKLWATLGVIGLAATGNLLAIFVAGLDSGWELVKSGAWILVAIAAGAGLLGIGLAKVKPAIAVLVIGFIAGADIALWFYEISAHIFTEIIQLPESAIIWIGLGISVIGGAVGYWLIRKYRDETLILITMLVGTELINDGLRLDSQSSLKAIIIITLALAGILWQYADYLRELEAETPFEQKTPTVSSMAYFQELELEDD